jgi:GNAT superfamily N-acetyltransferase
VSAEVRELTTDDEFVEAFPVMNELRTDLMNVEEYRKTLDAMRTGGYRLFAAVDGDRYVALAGVAIRTNFYYGRFLYVYDLITSESERSKGHGKLLLDHLEQLARADGCQTIALSSGVQRKDAHRFYEEKMGYDRPSYVFKKEL